MTSNGPSPASQSLVSASAPLTASGMPIARYVAPVPVGRSSVDLNFAKIHDQLIRNVDQRLLQNVYDSNMRMWIVLEPLNGPKGNATLDKVNPAILRLIKSECVLTNFSLVKYVNPSDSLNRIQCEEADKANARAKKHNEAIIFLMNSFIHQNDCGTSANHVTQPPSPIGHVKNMEDELKKRRGNELTILKASCGYLQIAKMFPLSDYPFEISDELANAVSFFREVTSKLIAKMVAYENPNETHWNLRVPGKPPSIWDGISPEDSQGTMIRWGAGGSHTFDHIDVFPAFKTVADPMKAIVISSIGVSGAPVGNGAYDSQDRFGAIINKLSISSKRKAVLFILSGLDPQKHSKFLENHPIFSYIDPACLVKSVPTDDEEKPAAKQTIPEKKQDPSRVEIIDDVDEPVIGIKEPAATATKDITPEQLLKTQKLAMPFQEEMGIDTKALDYKDFVDTEFGKRGVNPQCSSYSLSGSGMGTSFGLISSTEEKRNTELREKFGSKQGPSVSKAPSASSTGATAASSAPKTSGFSGYNPNDILPPGVAQAQLMRRLQAQSGATTTSMYNPNEFIPGLGAGEKMPTNLFEDDIDIPEDYNPSEQ